jgi:DNA-binding MarR family transcriptional regulator
MDSSTPLGFALGASARKLAKFYADALKDGPVTASQLYFLRQLWLEDGLALKDVGSRAQLDATSATWLADQLEERGLLERRRGPPDRRIVRVWLTSAGRKLQLELEPLIQQWEAGVFETIGRHHTEEELEIFRNVLHTLIAEMPDGNDLWAELSRSWDRSLANLRDYLEDESS